MIIPSPMTRPKPNGAVDPLRNEATNCEKVIFNSCPSDPGGSHSSCGCADQIRRYKEAYILQTLHHVREEHAFLLFAEDLPDLFIQVFAASLSSQKLTWHQCVLNPLLLGCRTTPKLGRLGLSSCDGLKSSKGSYYARRATRSLDSSQTS